MKFSQDKKAELLSMIESELPPWVKGWDGKSFISKNIISGRPYNGRNILITYFFGKRFFDGCVDYATSNQFFQFAKTNGYFKFGSKPLFTRINGEMPKPISIFYYSTIKKECDESCKSKNKFIEDGKTFNKIFIEKSYEVFNLKQTTPELQELIYSIVNKNKKQITVSEIIPKIIKDLDIKISLGSPSYSPKSDIISLPSISDFSDSDYFYESFSHELGHWTGAENRLNRDGLKEISFGSDLYAYEEAIAEWFSLFFSDFFKLPAKTVQNASYIKHWTERFSSDKTIILNSFNEAEKAFSWFLEKAGLSNESEPLIVQD